MLRSVQTPASRAGDPDTSRLAEAHINATGKRELQQKQAVTAVTAFPGTTCRELADKSGMDHEALHKRLSECVTAGAVRKGVAVTCTITGRKAATWFPV